MTLQLSLPRGVRLVANVSADTRVPWSARRPNLDGPEGWLSRTGLLPCHYFVHTFGSRATYALWSGRHHARPLLVGESLAHVERNWGDAFPTGWVWAQAAGAHSSAFLVLTGGRFVIGPLTTDSYVIGLRAPRAVPDHGTSRDGAFAGQAEGELAWDFRTTDLDRVVETRRPCDGTLTLNATSRDGRRHLALWMQAPPHSFGKPIYVPTSDAGFSNEPGCRESNTAVAHIDAWETSRAGNGITNVHQRLRVQLPLAVLEFGGHFQCMQ